LPKFTKAATLFLSPQTGSFSVGQTITVTVRTNTHGQDVNTAEANISYSIDTLTLTKVTQGSTFYLPAPGSPSKGAGTAYVGGGLPTPGYNGGSGLIGTLTFTAKAAGTANVTISSGKVLLNDGFGTDAYTGNTNSTFTITPATAKPTPTPTPSPEPTATPQPPPAPTPTPHIPLPNEIFTTSYLVPFYIMLAVNLVLIIILIPLLLLLFRRRKKDEAGGNDDELKRIQEEIDDSLEKLKGDISQKFMSLSARSNEELFEKETATVKSVRSGINKTRERIDKKISKAKKT